MNRLCHQRKIWKIMQIWRDSSRFLFWILWQYYLVNEVWVYGRIMLVLTSTTASFRPQCRSLLTIIVNWHLLCYKLFITKSFGILQLKYWDEDILWRKMTLGDKLYSSNGLNKVLFWTKAINVKIRIVLR